MTAVQSLDIPSVKDQVSEEEWKLRVDLAALYRLLVVYGWEDLLFTHISIRVPGPEHHFLMNPFGLMFDEITASSLVKIDLEGNIVMPSPYKVNKAGFTIHGGIHMSTDMHNCIIHTHSDDGVAVSTHKDGLLPITQHSMQVIPDLAYHDFEGIALNHDERSRLVADLGDKHCMILRNHGLLTVGTTAADTFLRHFFLERSCTMQVKALAGGADLVVPSEDVQALVGHQGGMTREDMRAEKFSWQPLLRKLDRIDPSYRD